ncbi:MAG: hypothetical protein QW165_01085 [Candidatus Woesearchaeota archaeon]
MKRGIWALGIIIGANSATAYIDPGTGSAVAGSIWPFILMLLGAIGAFFSRWLIKPLKKAWNAIFSKE